MAALSSDSATHSTRPRHPQPTVLPAASGLQSEWVSGQVRAMASAWSRGERVGADMLLAQHPGLGDEAAIRLIYEEVCLRREAGEELATTEVLNRFPRWKDELEVLLGCDRMLRPFSRGALFPEVGEDLGPFRLIAELGRGASGKTYLASERTLLNRLIVLKVITDDQEEHLSLAQLRHTHIIPLYSEQSFAQRGLRALCMPYLGGASLARVLEGLASISPAARRGRHILDVLDRMRSLVDADANIADGPYRRFMGQATYVQAICWIAACLADALHCAHTHGLIHMDVKPSNVLIAADGLPILLDFHLAHRPITGGERISDRLGGTPGWMAPEHSAALVAVSRGEPVPAAVDARADIYALGALLREALAVPPRGPGHEVSLGLSDIVAKCLAVNPADRYHDAALLADDLRRHLNELPLRGVANRSLAERWRKWRRRQPAALARLTAIFTTCAALVIALFLGQASYRDRVREIENALRDGRQLDNELRFSDAASVLGRGAQRARVVPGLGDLKRSLSHELKKAHRGQKAAALHELADLVRFRFGIDPPPPEEARTLFASIQSFWNDRDFLIGPEVVPLDGKAEQAIRIDLLDLTIASIEVLTGCARSSDADASRRKAKEIADLAATWCGPSARLDRLCRSLAGATDALSGPAAPVPDTLSALDHYDLGRHHLRAGRFQDAAAEFQRVVDERPQDFWPTFYQGLCAFRLRQFHEADAAFRTCIALAPRSAECYFNRARAAEALGHSDQAVRDYSRALELDARLTGASINRGILAYKSQRFDAAIADLKHALRSASDPRTVGLIEYNLALAYVGVGDHASALTSARKALSQGYDPARALSDRLEQEP